jgi:molecular chaperone GrpE
VTQDKAAHVFDEVTIGIADGTEVSEEVASEDVLTGDELALLRAERDGFLADSQRLAADFANFRKQSEKRVADAASAQSAGLVRDLIPVLDACDAALLQDPESAAGPIRNQLITELEKNGLELLAPAVDEAFDPEQHDAVMHEAAPADTEHDGPVIGEVLRAGYLWKGRVVRPAMVKVVG